MGITTFSGDYVKKIGNTWETKVVLAGIRRPLSLSFFLNKYYQSNKLMVFIAGRNYIYMYRNCIIYERLEAEVT